MPGRPAIRKEAATAAAPVGRRMRGLKAASMSKEKSVSGSPFVRGLFEVGIYKRSQGRITRQVTFAILAAAALLGSWRLWVTTLNWGLGGETLARWFGGDNPGAINQAMRLGVCGVLAVFGCWVAYRLVNMPRFADFLIAVEAEMNKVSWPTQSEMVRAVLVVLFSIGFLVVVLAGYDVFWSFVMKVLGITGGGVSG